MELRPQPTGKPRIALQALLDDALGEIGGVVGYDEASLMAYDPDVLLPVAFAARFAEARELAEEAVAIAGQVGARAEEANARTALARRARLD